MKGSDISSPPCHPACPERSTFPVSRVLHRGRRERSSPIFSSAPHLGTLSGGQPGSPLLRSLGGRGFKFTLRIEGPRRKPPQNNSSPNSFLRPNPRTGDFNRHERLFPLFSSWASGARFLRPACFTGMEGQWQHLNLNQAPRASNQLDRREAWVRSSPLLRKPGLQAPAQTTPKQPFPQSLSPP